MMSPVDHIPDNSAEEEYSVRYCDTGMFAKWWHYNTYDTLEEAAEVARNLASYKGTIAKVIKKVRSSTHMLTVH